MTPEQYLAGAGRLYRQFSESAGSLLDPGELLLRNLNQDDLLARFQSFMHDNMLNYVDHSTRLDDYHRGDTISMVTLPGTVGYNRRNTRYYIWGIRDELVSNEIVQLLGGAHALGLARDRIMALLLFQPPGCTVPWHADTMQKWRDANSDAEPYLVTANKFADMLAHGQDLEDAKRQSRIHGSGARIARRIVMITPWSVGHFMQQGRRVFTNWQSGDVFDSPPAVWHLTTNAGITPKISAVVTGTALE